MKRNLQFSLLLALLLAGSAQSGWAQDTMRRAAPTRPSQYIKPTAPVDPSLQGQYKDMLMRSRTQEGYKLINQVRLSNLWRNTMDTVQTERRLRLEAQRRLSGSAKSMEAMQDSLQQNQEDLDRSQASVNSISFLGIQLSKGVYNSVMWGLVLVLAAALAIIVFLTGKYKREAAYRIKLFEELTEEFQTYKSKANEREKKLARELQDERNKLDDLMNGNR